MTSRMRRLLVAFAVTAVSAMTLLVTTAGVALATVSGGLTDGQGMNVGRGGVFNVAPPTDWTTLSILGGLAISAALMALVAWIGIRSDTKARARLALAPGSGIGETLPARTEDQERKAA